jgi:Cold shock proteins
MSLRARISGCPDWAFEGSKVIGKVKWFNKLEGYGFIEQANGPDVLVHYSAIRGLEYRSLSAGDNVEFQTVRGPEGPQAANVKKNDRSSVPDQGLVE